MKAFEAFIPLAPWLGIALLRVTLVTALAVLRWLLARGRAPALRAALLLAGLVGVLVVPLLANVAPVVVPLPEVTVSIDATTPEPLPMPYGDGFAGPFDSLPPGHVVFAMGEDGSVQAVSAEAPAPTQTPAAAASPPPATPAPRGSLLGVLALVWLAGAAVCLAIALLRLTALCVLFHRAQPVEQTEEWSALLNRLGLPAQVAVRESDALDGPLAFPRCVLLPADWRTWSDGRREMVLAHELAHVRRRDFLAGLLAEFAVCLFWFHPLVRWLAGAAPGAGAAADAWEFSSASMLDSINVAWRSCAGDGFGSRAGSSVGGVGRNPAIHTANQERPAATTTRAAAAAVAGAGGFAVVAGVAAASPTTKHPL